MNKRISHYLLLICGSLSVLIGVIGIFVPVLPTTPFLVLAAFCYMHSSERFYTWLLNHKILGRYLRNYWEGRGIPLRDKILTLILLWSTIGFSAICVIEVWWGRLLLLLVAIGVTTHLLMIRTLQEDPVPEEQDDPIPQDPEENKKPADNLQGPDPTV
jgi:hypothetical protein